MLATLLAVFTAYPMANFAIWIIILAAIVALVLIFLQVAFGWQPPPWFWRACGIVVAAIVIIMLIIFLVQFASSPGPMFGRITIPGLYRLT